ncbi:MAG: hypothetical protein AMJ54_00990 [Deltaproteobacteria bacterium SG8_13]|nr:MAG: hypothetical protein AMJ54_00990 [Deltaproteobacteria bacterium SG8_13]
MSNYAAVIQDNLDRLYTGSIAHFEQHLPCAAEGDHLLFEAFGTACRITPRGIFLNGQPEDGPRGIVISLYALHHKAEQPVLEPFLAFKEMPDSGPYAAAFARHTETILVPHVPKIEAGRSNILKAMAGADATGPASGDISFHVRPLPKITLRYIFYRADEDFPASATCLFSHNALRFIPLDALADTAEYTSRRILELAE